MNKFLNMLADFAKFRPKKNFAADIVSMVWSIRRLLLIAGLLIALLVLFLLMSTETNTFQTPTLDPPRAISLLPTEEDSWHKVTLQEAIHAFRHFTQDSCPELTSPVLCAELPKARLSPEGQQSRCGPLTNDELQAALGLLLMETPLFGDKEYVYPWEKSLLQLPPLTDLLSLPSLENSRVTTIIPTAGDTSDVKCVIGHTLVFRLDIVDGHGNERGRGGDDVRAWTTRGDIGEGFSAAGQVEDLRNGSYLITTACLWPGPTDLKVGIAYPWEYMRAVVVQMRVTSGRHMVGYYSKEEDSDPDNPKANGISDVTPCSATPNMPWKCLCNYTKWNDGASFYCGRPSYAELGCRDLQKFQVLRAHGPLNVTKEEIFMMRQIAHKASDTLVSHNIQINGRDQGELWSQVYCHNTPMNKTWTMPSPQGFFRPGLQWQSLVCKTQDLKKMVNWCFKDLKVWVFGDSNGIRLVQSLMRLNSEWTYVEDGMRPFKFYRVNNETGFELTFYRHEYPVNLRTRGAWAEIPNFKTVTQMIDEIPSTGRHLVIAHHFLHLVVHHMSALEAHIQNYRGAFARLLERNPEAYVAYRGPHVSSLQWGTNHHSGGDTLITKMRPMIKEMFEPFWNKMIFLDGWDLTVASENERFHPPDNIPDAMIELLLSFICGRKSEG